MFLNVLKCSYVGVCKSLITLECSNVAAFQRNLCMGKES